jgi:hypothetical protein
MPDLAVLLNRMGLFLTFAAVWLVWPEILGESRLSRIEGATKRFLNSVPMATRLIVYLLFSVLAFALADWLGLLDFLERMRVQYGHTLHLPVLVATVVAAVVAEMASEWVGSRVCVPALKALAEGAALRRRLIDLGIVVFVVGFGLQLVASYL